MKVFENLENYEIPAGFRLTAEEEEKLASDLKEIVEALIPIRDSKLKTRSYFNQHLRYSSNKMEAILPPFPPLPDGSPLKEYNPLPGEYTWDSNLLQPALLDILRPDEYSFGFVVNYINEDMAHRKGQKPMRGSTISDALVKFFIKFDIDEIRAKAKAIEDLHDRLSYLNQVYTDYMIFDGLTNDESEWLAAPVGSSIKTLEEEAQKELELAKSRAEMDPGTKQKQRKSDQPQPGRKDSFNASRRMFWDFAIVEEDFFKPMGIVPTINWDKSATKNRNAFMALLNVRFSNCYDPDNDLAPDKNTLDLLPKLMPRMMYSYVASLKTSSRITDRAIIRKVTEWVIETHKLIDIAYENYPKIYSNGDPVYTPSGPETPEASTLSLKQAMLHEIYDNVPYLVDEYTPVTSDELEAIVPFNLWPTEYDELKRRYTNQFGLEFKKRAVVNVQDNKQFFAENLQERCVSFCNRVIEYDSLGFSEDPYDKEYNLITEWFHSLFRDYLDRARKVSNNSDDIDAALIKWTCDLEAILTAYYNNTHTSMEHRCPGYGDAYSECFYYFYDICSRIAYGLASGYYDDFDNLELVPSTPIPVVAPVPVTPPAPEPPAPVTPEEPESDKKHSCTIDYEKLYNAWNKVAFINVTLEQFTAAIDNADFALMLEKATDAGMKRGYIGCVKYIIKVLRVKLGTNWFELAASSIDETQDSLNKLHDDTKLIRKIDVDILDDYIE